MLAAASGTVLAHGSAEERLGEREDRRLDRLEALAAQCSAAGGTASDLDLP